MLLFFVPQLLNFAYSVPQLFRLLPCPRHRMPGYLPREDKLCNSYAEFDPQELGAAGKLVFRACETLRLARVERRPGERKVRDSSTYALYLDLQLPCI